jgi:protein phosphatase
MVGSSALPLHIGKATQQGIRPGKLKNEDSIDHFVSSFGDVFVLADGMGGHGNGDLASAIVVSSFRETLLASKGMGIDEAMRYALQIAHSRIVQTVDQKGLARGVGSTVVVAIIQDDAVWVGHVGDSRCYLSHENQLHQITHDHSLVQAEIDAGRLTEQEAAVDSRASTLTRAVGATENLELELSDPVVLQDGDAILLCSDGLHGFVDRAAIAYVVRKNLHDAQRVADALVSMAATVGNSDDDISVLFAQFGSPKINRPSPVFTEGRSDELLRKQAASPSHVVPPAAVPPPAGSDAGLPAKSAPPAHEPARSSTIHPVEENTSILSRILSKLRIVLIVLASWVLLFIAFKTTATMRPDWISSILPNETKQAIAMDSQPILVEPAVQRPPVAEPLTPPDIRAAVAEKRDAKTVGFRMKIDDQATGSNITFEVKSEKVLDQLRKRSRDWPKPLKDALAIVKPHPANWQYPDVEVVLRAPRQKTTTGELAGVNGAANAGNHPPHVSDTKPAQAGQKTADKKAVKTKPDGVDHGKGK